MTEKTTETAAPATTANPTGDVTVVAPGASSGDTAASTAPIADAAAAPTSDAKADAVSAPAPSLLSAAEGKPKADAKADAPAAETKSESSAKTETPAPADAAKPDEKAKETKEAPTDAAKADDAKAKDDAAKAIDPAKTADAAAQPPAPVTLEELKLPADIKLAEKESKAFLDTINDAKLDSKTRAQSLLDLHMAEIKRVAEETNKHQVDVWTKYNDGLKSELRADPEIGGNRLDTSLSMAKAVVEEYLPPESAAKLLAFMDYSGAGNHPEVVRLLNNIGTKLNIFEDKIVPAMAKAPAMPKSPGNRGWYDKSLNANGAGT